MSMWYNFIWHRFIYVQQLINFFGNEEQKQTNLDFNIKTKIIYNYDTILSISFSMNTAHFVKLSRRIIFIHFSHIHNFAHPKHTKFLAQTEWETWEKKKILHSLELLKNFYMHLNLLRLKEWQVTSTLNITFRERGTCPRGKKFLFWSFFENEKEARDTKIRGKFSSSAEELPSHRRRIRLAKWGWIFSGTVQCSAVPRRIDRTRKVWRQGI